MAQKSFFAILEEQVRQELRTEIEAEVRAEFAAPRKSTGSVKLSAEKNAHKTTEFWKMPPRSARLTSPSSAKSAYGVRPRAAQPKAMPAVAVAQKPEEVLALELLLRFAGRSDQAMMAITRQELKSLWRAAALKTHPDRVAQSDDKAQAQTAEIFRELNQAHEILELMFEEGAQAAD